MVHTARCFSRMLNYLIARSSRGATNTFNHEMQQIEGELLGNVKLLSDGDVAERDALSFDAGHSDVPSSASTMENPESANPWQVK